MKKRLVTVWTILFIGLSSCSNEKKSSNDAVCDCLESKGLNFLTETERNEVLTCLKDLEIELSLENRKTCQVIIDIEQKCPTSSRRLWAICKQMDEN